MSKKIKKVDKKLVWAGGQKLLTKVKTTQDVAERNMILVVAEVLGVSPFGVNILGGMPYINKLGLKQKLEEYGFGRERIEYRWQQYAKNDEEKAICEARIAQEDKPLTDWILGECSPKTMRMSTLAGYQNHLAQTRAHNRAIQERWGLKIHNDMLAKIAERKEKGLAVPKVETTLVSAEEIHAAKPTREVFVESPSRNPATLPEGIVIEAECHSCGNPMTTQEKAYSIKLYKKPLCRVCQTEARLNLK